MESWVMMSSCCQGEDDTIGGADLLEKESEEYMAEIRWRWVVVEMLVTGE